MKRLALAVAFVSAVMFSLDATAQPPGKEGGKRGKAAQNAKAGKGAGNRGQGRAAQAAQAGQAGQRDPSQLIARMMSEYDKDGDQKLDVTELTALLQGLRERRGQAGQGRPDGAGQGRGQAGQGRAGKGRPDGAGKGRPDGAGRKRGGKGGDEAAQGGAIPKRPNAE